LKGLAVASRHRSRGTRYFVLALLAGVLAAAPFALKGQEAAPAATAPAAAAPAAPAPGAAAKQESAKSDEEQTAAFRLEGPLVKATAKATGWSVELVARLFEIINFLIVALGLGIPLFRLMPKVFRKRSETVRSSLEEARKATEDANARLSAIESKLAGLDTEIARMQTQMEADSVADEARIKASIGEESTRIVTSAEQEIGQAAAQARRQLRQFAADLAIEQAAQQLSLTDETDQALIAEFIASADGASQGGQK
jgi:F-type H+-transporting ATPase subunit b